MELVCKPILDHKRHIKEHIRRKSFLCDLCAFLWLKGVLLMGTFFLCLMLTCLPTGVCLDPAGPSFNAGNMPLAMVLSPEGDRLVISLSGWRQQGLQVIDRHNGTVLQTIPQPSAFLGLAFSNDGQTLYASGGNEDVIYRYAWRDKQATLIDTIVLARKEPQRDGTRFPAGIALSRDDKYLFVAENLGDTLAVVDIESKSVVQRLQTETYPYAAV